MTDVPARARSQIRGRPDVRLDDEPMREVICQRCGGQVVARKSSWDQTTIQWTREALGRCEERGEATPPSSGAGRGAFPGCSSLKESVRIAAVRGDLPVLDMDPLRTDPQGSPD